jgi:HPt (histidine-containing phosphotransfer) domain-containing protein
MQSSSALPLAPFYLDIPKALESVGDREALLDMLGVLQDSLATDVPQIAHLIAQLRGPEAGALLHALKGFAPVFCTDALCAHIAQVELLSKTADGGDVVHAYAHLGPQLVQLQGEIHQYLQAHA